jgi:hypothetical protein
VKHPARDDYVIIRDNDLSSVDGRIYVSNSVNVDVHGNTHTRVPRGDNGQFAAGIALIYIGHETTATSAYDTALVLLLLIMTVSGGVILWRFRLRKKYQQW